MPEGFLLYDGSDHETEGRGGMSLDQRGGSCLSGEWLTDPAGLGVDLDAVSPGGYYVGLRLGFAFPLAERYRMQPGRCRRYVRDGLMTADPFYRWAMAHVGRVRWSALGLDAADQAFFRAMACQGMRFGATIAMVGADGARSHGHFWRADRELTEGEITGLQALLEAEHRAVVPPRLTAAETEALREVAAGKRLKLIAAEFGITHGAVKMRLRSAKRKLRADTLPQAVTSARSLKLI